MTVLPRLRRHAYILTGDREHADQTVLTCLQALRTEPDRIRPCHIRFDLFRLFHDVVKSPPRPGSDMPHRMKKTGASDLLHQLDALSPAQRRMLALVAIEGFSVDESAAVLGLDIRRGADLLASARRRLLLKGHPVDATLPP